jgi:peptidoglycan/xylan/chitin deacetylase (PgdA/CDA1 family)
MPIFWNQNTPQKFWLCEPPVSDAYWQEAIRKAVHLLDLASNIEADELPALTLGEGRFGKDHWKLSWPKRLYYLFKPLLPRALTRTLRRYYGSPSDSKPRNNWPIDPRYVSFQWELIRQILIVSDKEAISYKSFWPNKHRFAFILTHDVETAEGQAFVRRVADMEENLGFRSSFNFVLERYPLDFKLIEELKARGFEVGCHGLKHDGKLFSTKKEFIKRAATINKHLREYGMVGFRAPLTHRNPEWMQALEIEYDLSFFDTDPFEPIPGGAMSIWPFFIGHFVELPYTLVQDYTLTAVLGETSPRKWLEKVDFIEKYHGMALLNSHPDYLKTKRTWDVYHEFLVCMKQRKSFWHDLPREVAAWWRMRNINNVSDSKAEEGFAVVSLKDQELQLAN